MAKPWKYVMKTTPRYHDGKFTVAAMTIQFRNPFKLSYNMDTRQIESYKFK